MPDQAPAAEHDAALVELHVSVETPPFGTEVGFAARDTDADAAAGDSSPAPPQAVSTSAGTSSRPLTFKVAPHSLIAAAALARTACLAYFESASRLMTVPVA